jgi:hypothetical protein
MSKLPIALLLTTVAAGMDMMTPEQRYAIKGGKDYTSLNPALGVVPSLGKKKKKDFGVSKLSKRERSRIVKK